MITDGIKNILGFTFKGRHSSEFNLATKTVKRIIAPEQRTFDFKVSGRHGSIEYETGEYEDIYLEVEYHLIPSRDLKDFQEISKLAREMSEWITGSGILIFDHEPDKYYEARVFSSIEAEYMQTGVNILTGPLVFKCTPFAYSVKKQDYNTTIKQNPPNKTTYSNMQPLHNKGSMPTMPLIVLKNNGYDTINKIEFEIVKIEYSINYNIDQFIYEHRKLSNTFVITGVKEAAKSVINGTGELFIPAYTEYNLPITVIDTKFNSDNGIETSNIKHIEIEDGIEEIREDAFYYMNQLNQSVLTLPQSIKKVGKGAFNNVSNIDDNIKLDLSNLHKLEIIEDSAFDLYRISELLLPPNVKVIKNSGFNLDHLNTNILDWSKYNKLESIYDITASKIQELTLPTSLREIKDINCSSLTKINLPQLTNLISIGQLRYTKLPSLYFPDSLSSINSITQNSELETIDLSNTAITKTPSISNNPKLKTIKYPKEIKEISAYSFDGYNTDKLDLSMYNNLTKLSSLVFTGLIINANPEIGPRERIILPTSIKEIELVNLKKDNIPADTEIDLRNLKNLKTISRYAFKKLTIVLTQEQKNKFNNLDSSTTIKVE